MGGGSILKHVFGTIINVLFLGRNVPSRDTFYAFRNSISLKLPTVSPLFLNLLNAALYFSFLETSLTNLSINEIEPQIGRRNQMCRYSCAPAYSQHLFNTNLFLISTL